jgi:hypothetical protein
VETLLLTPLLHLVVVLVVVKKITLQDKRLYLEALEAVTRITQDMQD